MEIVLREYREGDVEAMYALDVECFEPVFRFSRGAMRRFAEAEEALTVMAEASGGLVGFAVVNMEGPVGYVVTLDVASEWRRQGLGQRLMEEMERRVRGKGGMTMELHVFEGNAGAARLYGLLGYGLEGVVEDFYGPGLDALLYRKALE